MTDSLWERLEQGGNLWLQGPPGSAVNSLLCQMIERWKRQKPGRLVKLRFGSPWEESDLAQLGEGSHAPQESDALVLTDFRPTHESLGTLDLLVAQGWKRVLISSCFDPPIGMAAHVEVTVLTLDQSTALISGRLGRDCVTTQPIKALAQKIGGSYEAALSAAELIQLIPPGDIERFTSDAFRVFDLSPRRDLLAQETLSCLEVLSKEEASAAMQWAAWGVPMTSEVLEDLLGRTGPALAASLVKLHLAQQKGREVRLLPHFVWAVRRSEPLVPALVEEAWRSLIMWMLARCGEDDFAFALVFERRSASTIDWVQAWKQAAEMAQGLGFSEAEQCDLKLMAACHGVMGDCHADAEAIISDSRSQGGDDSSLKWQIIEGVLKSFLGEAEEAAALLRKGAEKARRQGSLMLEAAACFRLGYCLLDQGQIAASSSALRQGISAARAGAEVLLPKLMDLYAFIAGLQGRSEESLQLQLESLRAWERSDLSCAGPLARLAYGLVCWIRGHPDQAEQEVSSAIEGLVEEELLDDAVMGFATSAAAAVARGAMTQALHYVACAESHARTKGSTLTMVWSNVTRCWALMALGRIHEAESLMKDLGLQALAGRHRLFFPAILALYAGRASLMGEHRLAVMLEGAAESERKRNQRVISPSEQMALGHFLASSHMALFPEEAAACLAEGAWISAEEAVSILLLDRWLLNQPEDAPLRFKRRTQLGRREEEVLELLAQGCSNPQIAAVFAVSVGTVKKQVHVLKRKLNCDSRISLMHAGQRLAQSRDSHPPAKSR